MDNRSLENAYIRLDVDKMTTMQPHQEIMLQAQTENEMNALLSGSKGKIPLVIIVFHFV